MATPPFQHLLELGVKLVLSRVVLPNVGWLQLERALGTVIRFLLLVNCYRTTVFVFRRYRFLRLLWLLLRDYIGLSCNSRLSSFTGWPWHCLIRGWVFRNFSNRHSWQCLLCERGNYCRVRIVSIQLVCTARRAVVDYEVYDFILTFNCCIQILFFVVWR